MELRHIQYFVAVAEEQNITRAAERLWIAQPGLSTQIRRLEAELGIRLFDRHARGVNLTSAGELFLQRARAALAAAEDARSTARDLEAGVIGTVRLGIATGTPCRRLPVVLDAFGAARPDVEVTVVESHAVTLLRDLRDRRLDAVAAPALLAPPELRGCRLGTERWAVLAGGGHRLAAPGPVDADELHGEPFVVTAHRDGVGYDRAVAEVLSGLGVTPTLRRGGAGPALFSAVAAGDALALTTAAASPAAGMVLRPVAPARTLHVDLLWRDETPTPALGGMIRTATGSGNQRSPRLAERALIGVAGV